MQPKVPALHVNPLPHQSSEAIGGEADMPRASRAASDDYHVCSCVSQENATVKRQSDKTVKTKKTITPRLISWGLSAKWRP